MSEDELGDSNEILDKGLEENLAKIKKKPENSEKLEWNELKSVGYGDKSIYVLAENGVPKQNHLAIGEKLGDAWRKRHKVDGEESIVNFTALQKVLFDPIFSNFDIYNFCTSWNLQKEYRELYCLYILNEIQLLRSRILHNNKKVVEMPDFEARDQGFTRPRVVILVPFRNTALDLVQTFGGLWTAMGGQLDNQKRLFEEFGPGEEEVKSDNRRKSLNGSPEFIHTFRDNIDDCFRIGIKCTRKALKLFCDFYSSDIIVASPLGMRMIIDGQSEIKKVPITGTHKTKKKRIVKKGDHDFLSSIQMLIIDQADVIAMQNWSHLVYVVAHLNKLPKDSHGCDFSRVQSSFLDGLAANTRQNLVFSEYLFPELNSLIKGFYNRSGKWKLVDSTCSGYLKKIRDVTPQFHVIDIPDLISLPQIRFQFFLEEILPKYSQAADHVCIFIPSYFDFVQLREHFQSTGLSHAILSEYCTTSEISAARVRFFGGQVRFLLVTERFYFFKRYKIRGIKQLIFYSLPDHEAYFEQWCNFLELEHEKYIPILLSRFDYLKVERIVGTNKIRKLIS